MYVIAYAQMSRDGLAPRFWGDQNNWTNTWDAENVSQSTLELNVTLSPEEISNWVQVKWSDFQDISF